MKERKSISKSVRMTQQIYDTVCKFEGNGFNEKFENLVQFCCKKEKDIKQAIKNQENIFENQKAHSIKTINTLNTKINEQKEFLKEMSDISETIEEVICLAEQLINKQD